MKPVNVDRWQDPPQWPNSAQHFHDLKGSIIDATTLPSDMTPAWIVYAWAPVLWQAASAPDLHLVHLGTRVLNFGDDDGPCNGQTLWGGHSEACAAGVAWDWVELRRGVVAMSDPLGMVTNLRLLDARGEEMSQTQMAVQLHQLVHALPWQSEVERALRKTVLSRVVCPAQPESTSARPSVISRTSCARPFPPR